MMWKKSLMMAGVLAVLLMGFTTADAHTRKGTWMLQGSAALSSSSGNLYGNENRTEFQMAPGVHYFVMNKLALGGEMPLATMKQGDVSRTSLYIGPSAEYYFGDLDATTNPYLGAGVFVRQESLSTPGPANDISESGSDVALKGGLALFLRENLAVKPELSVHFENLDGSSGTTVQMGIGLAGFLY